MARDLRVLPDTSAEELIRLMLDKFIAQVGEERLKVAKDRGMTFYEVLTLASIVEREAVLPEEKPLIAGVYQNRINGIKGVKNKLLNADPTVIYGVDSVALAETPLEEWLNYFFWKVPETPMKDIALPENLQGFQTYQVPGLVPWPIATPSLGSIDAALAPDTKDKYIYFSRSPTAVASTRSPRHRPSTRRTATSTATTDGRRAGSCPSRLTSPRLRRGNSWRPGMKPTGPPGLDASPGSASASPRRAWTPISAFVASTCATSPVSPSPRARRSRQGTPGSSS